MKMKALILLAISTLAAFSALEIALRVFDPAGVVYFDDLTQFRAALTDDASGYAMPPGAFDLSHWSYRIEPDGTRHTPGRMDGSGRVAFFGDSVTFCWGVEDAECWVSLIAETLGLNAVNYGRTAYNADDAVRLMRASGERCAVWMTISNDADQSASVWREMAMPSGALYLQKYLAMHEFRTVRQALAFGPTPEYDAALAFAAARPDTLILALGEGYGKQVQERFPSVVIVPSFTERISFADAHANAAGNRQIADAVTPIIAAWLEGRDCE